MRSVPAWVTKYPHKKYFFDELPIEAKKAVVIYMFGARADVQEVEKYQGRRFSSIVKEFETENSDVKFALYNVPIKAVAERAMEESNNRGDSTYENVDEWYEMYEREGDIPKHKTVWPLLGGDEEEVIQDGWHRLGAYIRAAKRTVPVLFFLESVDNIFG